MAWVPVFGCISSPISALDFRQAHAAHRNPTSPTPDHVAPSRQSYALVRSHRGRLEHLLCLRNCVPPSYRYAWVHNRRSYLSSPLKNRAHKNSMIHLTGLWDPHWPCLRPTRSLGWDGDDPHGIAGTKITPPRLPLT
jgi:hypothetical protein